MANTTVVELKLVDGNKIETAARFVLVPDGTVQMVPFGYSPENVWRLVGDQLPGRDGLVGPDGGRPYLEALRGSFQGSYLWATEPFEMDLDEALRPELRED